MPPFKEVKKPEVKKQEVNPVEEPKQEEPKQEEPKQEEPKQEEPKTFTVQKLKCRSKIYMVNPFTGDRFIPNDEIDATMDSWLDCQIKAGLVEPCS